LEVKICGIRDGVTARTAAESGARALGFVFAASPRRIEPEEAARIAADLGPGVALVAVFRHPSAMEVERVLDLFPADIVQAESGSGLEAARERGVGILPVLHDGAGGGEPSDRPGGKPTPVLLEASGVGGRGIRPDWDRAAALARRRPLVLAGGLTPENVREAIRHVDPAAVDVSSGVESFRGVKDLARVRAFVAAAQAERPAGTRAGEKIRPVFERAAQ
jgi:phosphoribosylanthranilate isomerase